MTRHSKPCVPECGLAGVMMRYQDAAMPHHNHGMNHVPLIERTGPGRWHVEDMLFHMPGYWELYFDIQDQGITHRAQEPLEID